MTQYDLHQMNYHSPLKLKKGTFGGLVELLCVGMEHTRLPNLSFNPYKGKTALKPHKVPENILI